jgi:hypothetical protein
MGERREAVDFLLERDGNRNMVCVNNDTALHRAAWCGDLAGASGQRLGLIAIGRIAWCWAIAPERFRRRSGGAARIFGEERHGDRFGELAEWPAIDAFSLVEFT